MQRLDRVGVSRRTFLRGVGASLALPWLEGLEGLDPDRAAAPLRLVYVYAPNGMHMPDWVPATTGTEFELPWILEPLAGLRARLSVLSGLAHQRANANGDGPGDHARAAATFLTGVQAWKGDGTRLSVGVSADQLAARFVGKHTRFASLEVGCEEGRLEGQCDSGYPCAYSSTISWRSERVPMAKETDPRRLFDRLFRDGRPGETEEQRRLRHARERSVLDLVRGEAKRLSNRLGEEDRRRLDEYETGVRELERRLQHQAEPGVGQVASSDPAAGFERPGEEPEGFAERADLFFDLLALALATHSTRVATFLLANEGTNRPYPEIEISDGHHSLSHHRGSEEMQAKVRRINRFYVERFARFLERLADTSEGEHDLLHNSMVVLGSGLSDGNRHTHADLPVLLAGNGGGTLRPGQHVRAAPGTPMNDLHLALLERMGAGGVALGDGRAPLTGI